MIRSKRSGALAPSHCPTMPPIDSPHQCAFLMLRSSRITRNTCVSAFICGSHICKVQPSEFDSIRVGPPSRPSTDTLSRQPSASIIGIGASPGVLLFLERGEQAVDQGLG